LPRRVAAALRLSDRVVFVTNGSIDVLARPSPTMP